MLILQGDSVFYFLETQRTLEEKEIKSLEKVLNATLITDLSQSQIILPRKGLTSPWSSKAAELLKIFNLPVKKIWRGQVGSTFDLLLQENVKDFASYFKDSLSKKKLKFLNWKNYSKEQALQLLEKVNVEWGLALSREEMEYLYRNFCKTDLSDAQLLMFAQVNSEHCRHKIFSASWEINGDFKDFSLFQMIKNTFKENPRNILSAYSDNAAVLRGEEGVYFFIDSGKKYSKTRENIHFLIKVETHNHPTAVSPFPGAATGSGGEIRDEGMIYCVLL